MYIVILAGGSGTRFWPLSRKRTPKQLMSVFGGRSMLQRTVERVLPLAPQRVLIVTNALQAAETARQMESLRAAVPIDIIAEPVGRNTAPAIGLAATIIARYDPDGMMVVLPADHYIRDEEGFCAVLRQGCAAAVAGSLVTLGIAPDRPETGYGYIEADTTRGGNGPFPVRRFVEKPDLERALGFLAAGNFSWNSGMFIWRADVILEQILTHMPDLAAALATLQFSPAIWELADLQSQIDRVYGLVANVSIDYGVMEKASGVVVIPASFGWSDVGSWSALPDLLDADSAGNVLIDKGEAVLVEAGGCLAHGGGKLVALLGVRDLVVVNTDDALLVCPRERAQDVRKIVAELKKRGLDGYL